MAINDKIKWDKKYKEIPTLLEDRDASKKLIDILPQIKGNKALEIACGAGRNSIFLAKNSFVVDALDISDIALLNLKNKGFENINTEQIDLDDFQSREDSYDIIVMTNFLDRNIIPKLTNSLKKDGILLIETYMHHEENNKPNYTKSFLLEKDELKTFFDDKFEVLEYDEYDNEPNELYKMRKQSIIIRK